MEFKDMLVCEIKASARRQALIKEQIIGASKTLSERLERAVYELRNGGRLNSCGVVQRLGSEIDSMVKALDELQDAHRGLERLLECANENAIQASVSAAAKS